MALIEKGKGRKDGGYSRLFGNSQLGSLISRVHSTVISSGTELEKLVKENVSLIDDLDEFLEREIMPEGVFLVDKPTIKNCKSFDSAGAEPDFIVFKRRNEKQACHVIELKDGDAFDTKKASAEHHAMRKFISKNAQHLQYTVHAHFCCFNQNDKKKIVEGFKNKIPPEAAMTGQEFCDLLEIEYETLNKERTKDQYSNLNYFLSELIKIDVVRDWIKKHFN